MDIHAATCDRVVLVFLQMGNTLVVCKTMFNVRDGKNMIGKDRACFTTKVRLLASQ